MNKLELLKTKLQQARKELNDKGYHYDPEMYDKQGYDALMNIKPFEIKYQDVIEEIWPDEAWWKVTNYWDIFDAMAFGGLNDETVIDEICNHVDRAFLDEACKIEESLDKELKELETKYGCKFEEGHTHAEYEDEFGDEYENGELWDYSIDDIKSGAVEPQKGLVYWLIYDKDDELRVFETLRTINESKELKEGTSNFGWLRKFPLLVFYTWDEIDGKMRYAQGYPEIEQFTTDKGNGDFHVDYDAYYDALDKFEQEYWDSVDTCVLNEDELESLEDAIYNFNEETEQIANDLWDAGNEDDYYVLKDIKLKVEPGYYEAAYIDVDDEKEFDYLSDKVKEEQLKRFNDFFDTLKKDFGLSHYEVAWGPASNGETGYKKVESLKEENESNLKDIVEKQGYITLRQWAEAPAGTYCMDYDFGILKLNKNSYLTSDDELSELCQTETADELEQSISNCASNNEIMSDEELDDKWLSDYDVSIGDGKLYEEELEGFYGIGSDDALEDYDIEKEDWNRFVKNCIALSKKNESLKESKELKLSDVKEGQTFKVLDDVVYCDINEEGMFEDDEELLKEFTDNGFKLEGDLVIIPANTVLSYDMSQSVDVYSIVKTDYQFEVGEWSEEALNTKVEIIATESLKESKKYSSDTVLTESKLEKTTFEDTFKAEDKKYAKYISELEDALGAEELYGGNILEIKNIICYMTYNIYKDGVDAEFEFQFDALVDGDFDETDAKGNWIDKKWIRFKLFNDGPAFNGYYTEYGPEVESKDEVMMDVTCYKGNLAIIELLQEAGYEPTYNGVETLLLDNVDDTYETDESLKESKKDCHVNTNAGDPVKNAEFFNASMGTSSEGGTVGEDLKEELKDEEIFDILGIEEDNRESSDYLLSQFRELAKKHDKNKIYLKGDVGISVKGNVIDSTEDLAVVDESLKEDLKVSTDDTTIHVDSLDAVTTVQSDEGTVVVQSNGDVTVHTDDVDISKKDSEVNVDVKSDVAVEAPVIADVSPEAEATAELIAEPVETPVDDATVNTPEDASVEIETQESLKEGYIGQTVEDFLGLVVDPEVIETLIISDIDAEDYDENFKGIYDELDDSIKESDYADFDVGGNTLVINASEDEDDAGDFYQTVEDLLEDYNGDLVEVQVDGETKFSGDKSDIEESVAQLTLVSIDAPKYLCINAHLGGVDESLKEKNKLNEEPVYNLDTRYDTRDSFYGKAKVDVRGDGSQILYSYGTPVCIITKDGDVKLLRKGYLGWFSSQTTLRHVKEFLKQNGKEIGTKNELNKMYPTEDAYDYVR